MEQNKICIVGWHFFPTICKYFDENFPSDYHIVSHRYNPILDELNLNYSIIKNIGLEFHCYDCYIKNIWDGKSNVLFMHDDVKIFDKKVINKIFKKCNKYAYVYILSKSRDKIQGKSYRCFYLSRKMIKLLLKEFNGIWYDKNNKGYVAGEKHIYDSVYTEKYARSMDGVGRQLKRTFLHLREKYNLKWNRIPVDDIYFFRRGTNEGYVNKYLVDNSIFNRKDNNVLENIFIKEGSKRRRDINYYSKWYNFYLDEKRNDNLNILELGIKNKNDLKIWEKYFKNSDIYGIGREKIENENMFLMNEFSESNLSEVCNKISSGIDIVIDNGSLCADKRIEMFEFLFNKMNNWGIYIIEDLYKNDKNMVNFLKDKIDNVNYGGRFKTNNIENNISEKSLIKYECGISAINFHSGICFVFKRFLGIKFNG